MSSSLLTSYDPTTTAKGNLDPIGLYQLSDQLAVQLVPGRRELMKSICFHSNKMMLKAPLSELR